MQPGNAAGTKQDAHGKSVRPGCGAAAPGAARRSVGRALFDAPAGGRELDHVESLCGVALGAGDGDDGGQGVVVHHVLAAANEDGTGHAFAVGHQGTGDCFHPSSLAAHAAEVHKTPWAAAGPTARAACGTASLCGQIEWKVWEVARRSRKHGDRLKTRSECKKAVSAILDTNCL